MISNPWHRNGKKGFRPTTLLLLCAALLFLLAGFYSKLTPTSYTLEYATLPEAFDGYTILEIADLHSYSFGAKQEKLVAAIQAQRPDLIVLAGDIIDKRDRDTGSVLELLRGIGNIAPIYAVAGNHELENRTLFPELLELYRTHGVIYLDGDMAVVERNGQRIVINGGKLQHNRQDDFWVDNAAEPALKNEFNILLHHFGNEFDFMSDEYDLVFSGHVHGGIVRLFGAGVFGNAPALFPRYDKGVFRKPSGSAMVLSAGLGDTWLPRFSNRRELVTVTLRKI